MGHATRRVESPLGPLELEVDGDGAVTRIEFDAALDPSAPPGSATATAAAALDQVARQLADYFAGRRRTFELALAPIGTPFQRRVWAALVELPYGTTSTYGALAAQLGDPRAVRAVGGANGRNPIAIVVPCHRVIGKRGTLVGYAAGLERKRALLALEGCAVAPDATPAAQLTLL